MNNDKANNYMPLVLICFLLIIAAFLFYNSPIKIFFSLKDVFIGIGCSLIYFINYYLSKLLRRNKQLKKAKNPLVSSMLRSYFRDEYVVFIIILMATIEEFAFRSFLLKSSLSYFNVYVSVIVNAILFSITHFSKFKFIQLTLMGVLLATITLLTNNLLPSIIGHVANNLIIFFKVRYKSSKLATNNNFQRPM